jgi:hypothetical protein
MAVLIIAFLTVRHTPISFFSCIGSRINSDIHDDKSKERFSPGAQQEKEWRDRQGV